MSKNRPPKKKEDTSYPCLNSSHYELLKGVFGGLISANAIVDNIFLEEESDLIGQVYTILGKKILQQTQYKNIDSLELEVFIKLLGKIPESYQAQLSKHICRFPYLRELRDMKVLNFGIRTLASVLNFASSEGIAFLSLKAIHDCIINNKNNANLSSKNGLTPIMYATCYSKSNFSIIQLLLNLSADNEAILDKRSLDNDSIKVYEDYIAYRTRNVSFSTDQILEETKLSSARSYEVVVKFDNLILSSPDSTIQTEPDFLARILSSTNSDPADIVDPDLIECDDFVAAQETHVSDLPLEWTDLNTTSDSKAIDPDSDFTLFQELSSDTETEEIMKGFEDSNTEVICSEAQYISSSPSVRHSSHSRKKKGLFNSLRHSLGV